MSICFSVIFVKYHFRKFNSVSSQPLRPQNGVENFMHSIMKEMGISKAGLFFVKARGLEKYRSTDVKASSQRGQALERERI